MRHSLSFNINAQERRSFSAHRTAEPPGFGNQTPSSTVVEQVNLIEVLKVAVAAIWAHKLRSALTLLGMIVGVTAFVTVVSLIQGFNVYIDEKIAGIGAKSFSVQRFNPFQA